MCFHHGGPEVSGNLYSNEFIGSFGDRAGTLKPGLYFLDKYICGMDDNFVIPVEVEGKEMEFPATLRTFGYTVKVEVDVDGIMVSFEPDEERNWRAVLGFDDAVAGKSVKVETLEAIAEFLETVTK